MSTVESTLINTPLQPGAQRAGGIQPLQRFLHAGSFGMMFAKTPYITPMLACHGPSFTPWQITLALSVLAAWVISCVLYLVNFGLIFSLPVNAAFKRNNLLFSIFFGGVGFALCRGWLNKLPGLFLTTLVFALPLLIIFHFTFLLQIRKRLRREIGAEKQSDTSP